MHITEDSVLTVLSDHIGRGRGVRADILVAHITGDPGPDPAGMRYLRQVITELRMAGYHICGHPASGYFMAETAEELDATCEFLYERAMTGLMQISRMKHIALPDLRGQLKLPT